MNFLVRLLCVVLAASPALATYKEEFKDHSNALKAWFRNAETTEQVRRTYGLYKCCEYAERVKTKFDASFRDGHVVWFLECIKETNTFCTNHGKTIGEYAEIPPGIIHDEPIDTPTKYADGGWIHETAREEDMAKVEEEFEQLRAEGVLFIYKGDPVCFWPPGSGG